ncbi:hypothetical protein [Mycobacteroides abscessus]|uniref:hypothetical protein n=1 Tax=Mycobacteroides abscessus TaxID=36809 RepID=UPI0021060FA5|nr:hypothetical protein [Mycobacteroides abscessus]
MNERLRSPPERSERNRLLARAFGEVGAALSVFGESVGVMKYFAPVQEDLELEPGEPTRAERLGADVIVVRVGARRMSRQKIRRAAEAIRSLK